MSRTPSLEEMAHRLERVLAVALPSSYTWEWLKGDGSNRAYARVHFSEGTQIAMVLADPDPHKQAEEIEEGGNNGDEIPFVAIQKLLLRHGLPVPRIFFEDREQGVLLIEDLGDTLLEQKFGTGVPLGLYKEAIALLFSFQRIPPEPHLLFRRRFSLSLLLWEVEHFWEYGIEVRTGRTLPERTRLRWRSAWERALEPLVKETWVPVHRDYHSRNLMVDSEGRLRWLDFQDALLGHVFYDLASLLYDAYVDLPEPERAQLFRFFCEKANECGHPLPPEFHFYLLAIQRMLKAAGRFVYFHQVKQKPQYLRYIPRLLARVHTLFAEFPHLLPTGIVEEMAEYVPEWGE